MKSTEIRQLWKEFWETKAGDERVHAWAKPASLIVNNAEDPTTMFNTAGMQQFVPYLMGKKHPLWKRLYNIQWCVRTTDIEEVGDVSHLTFFEMMGNWSLGDYFNKESIERSWEFLTQWLKLDPKMLAVSVFEWDQDAPKDDESAGYRQDMWVPRERIAYLPKSENWRGPAWTTWPCGPDTEIFYWIGEGEAPEVFDPEKDDDHWLEIWNNVFMAYYKDEKGEFSELADKNVDTGMGFERLCLVMQCVHGLIDKPIKEASVYETDIFADIMDVLAVLQLPKRYQRIMADHLRTAFWLIQEWLVPSNEWRGYVLRRVIRRAYFVSGLWNDDNHLERTRQILMKIKTILNEIYDDMFDDATISILLDEVEQFSRTIHHGEKQLQEMLDEAEEKLLTWAMIFKLYDTYGFPVELTQELAEEKWYTVDLAWFEQEMEKAQQRSRAGSKKMFAKEIDRAAYIDEMPPTEFVGYEHTATENVSLLKEFELQWQKVMIFNKTPFYAESGGQTGDTWTIELDGWWVATVTDVQKYGGVYLHFVE